MLAALIFALPGLNWNWPSDHVELFSGQAAVSRAEIEDWGQTASTCLRVHVSAHMCECNVL